jgi:signal transduction histidine kinase
MKTRTKIVWMLASIFVGIIILFSILIYTFNSRYAFADFYKRLEVRALTTAKSELEHEDFADLAREFKGEYLEPLLEESHFILEKTDTLSVSNLSKEYNLNQKFVSDLFSFKKATFNRNNVFYCGITYQMNGVDYLVVASAVNYYYDHHMTYLRNLLLISIIVATLFIVLIAYWISIRLINPLKEITQEVNKISSENLFVRLNERKSEDEMSELVKTFNNMLDRLQTSFETQNNFISNASHELNTPLTSIIGEADVALARPRTTDEYIEVLRNILNEAGKLDQKTKALLYLAQTGFNGKTLLFEKVRIDQLILDVRETIYKIHPESKLHIDFSKLPDSPEKLMVKGSNQLLHLALSNILLNAFKYSNNNSVSLTLKLTSTHVEIVIKDKGIGIPQDEMEFIYDPFYRASNTSSFEGYGIGLPLTKNIIKLHRGELLIDSKENHGTDVLVKIPIGNYSL